MAYLNANIPVEYAQIRREYLYDLKKHHGEVEDCIVFGMSSLTGKSILFHAIMENGAIFYRLPISAFIHDILSDLGPACTGTIGIAPSGNINPTGKFPSLFEPVHGSAPDIAGRGIANPVGQIWAGAMMLDHLGHNDASTAIIRAIEEVLADPGSRTFDLGGTAGTATCGKAIAKALLGAILDRVVPAYS